MKKLLPLIITVFLLTSCGSKPEADFTWTPLNPKAGQEVQFNNRSTDAKTYSWNLGNMSISEEKNPKTTYNQAGNYIIDLYAYRGLKSDLKTLTINVVP